MTPGRSIAVDRLHAYGTPFFIQANLPIESVKSVSPFGRLVIAQDTGSAIVGPARADLYWGAGDDAGRIANRIRHPGRFVMLLPREIDMTEAARHMPLPPPKPKALELAEVSKYAKGKVDSAAAQDKQRQVGARKLPSRDCATGPGIDCGRKSAPSVAITSKRLTTTSQAPSGDKPQQQQQHQRQQSQKQQLAQQPQPGVQGRGPEQQQGKSRGPRQKQQLQATAGREPQQRQQQAAIERRGPQQKRQPPPTDGRAGGNQQQQHQQQGPKQQLAQQPQPGVQGWGPRQPQSAAQDRGPQQKQQLKATAGRELQRRQPQAAVERRGPQQKLQSQAERRGPQQKQQPSATEGGGRML